MPGSSILHRDHPRLTSAQPWLSTVGRLFLAGVWLFAGWPKFVHSDETVRSVQAFEILPAGLVRPVAYGLPLLELVLGLLLLVGLITRVAALVTALMMVVFMVGIVSAWSRGLDISCGCFGNTGATVSDPVPGYIKDLFRDTGFLIVAGLLARWPYSRFSLDGALGLTRRPVVRA